jgi:hypothetical protein
VDFWDLTKLLARRWYVALPMLLLSVLLTMTIVGRVKPDYIATAYVQLVAPVQGATKPGQASPEQRNPWLGQGLGTLGNAAMITVQDRTIVQELKAAGLSDSYTVEMGGTTPMISFEVVGSSEQQARESADLLVRRFNESVATLQSDDRVPTADAIRTRRLDRGTNVEESDSKVKRALVAVAGAGLLLTAAATIGLDAWLRRRSRRRKAAAPAMPVPPVSGQVRRSLAAESAHPRPNGVDPVEADAPTTLIPTGNGNAGGTAGAAAPAKAGAPAAGRDAPAAKDASAAAKDGGPSTVVVEYQPSGERATADAPEHEPEAAQRELPADATIVLPLSLPAKEHWPGRNEKKQRP